MHPDYVYSRRPNGAKRSKAKRASTPSSAGSSGEYATPSVPSRSARRSGTKAFLSNSSSKGKQTSITAAEACGSGAGGYVSSASSTCSTFFPSAPASVFATPSRVNTPAYAQQSSTAATASSSGYVGASCAPRATPAETAAVQQSAETASAAQMLASIDLAKSVAHTSIPKSEPISPVQAPMYRSAQVMHSPAVLTATPAPISLNQSRSEKGPQYVENPVTWYPEHGSRAQQPSLYSSSGSSSFSSSTGSGYSSFYQSASGLGLPLPVRQAVDHYDSQTQDRTTSPLPPPLPATLYRGPAASLKTGQRLTGSSKNYTTPLPPLDISLSRPSLPTGASFTSFSSAYSSPVPSTTSTGGMSAVTTSPTMLANSTSRRKTDHPPVSGRRWTTRDRNGSDASMASSSDGSVASAAFSASALQTFPASAPTVGGPYLLPRLNTSPATPLARSCLPMSAKPEPARAVEIYPGHPVQPQPTSLPSLSSMRLPGLGHEAGPGNHASSPQDWSASLSLPVSATNPSPEHRATAIEPSAGNAVLSDCQDAYQANAASVRPSLETRSAYSRQAAYAPSLYGYTIYQPPPRSTVTVDQLPRINGGLASTRSDSAFYQEQCQRPYGQSDGKGGV